MPCWAFCNTLGFALKGYCVSAYLHCRQIKTHLKGAFLFFRVYPSIAKGSPLTAASMAHLRNAAFGVRASVGALFRPHKPCKFCAMVGLKG